MPTMQGRAHGTRLKLTDQTLIEQLKISKNEINRRKEYLNFTKKDVEELVSLRDLVAENLNEIVVEFYDNITPFDEMDRVIGDAETLIRLKGHQRKYILNMFCGQYDDEYVQSRLRVGVVHKRIGLDPKYFVAAVHSLISILRKCLSKNSSGDCTPCMAGVAAMEKIAMFDLTLIFDTYIHSLIEETKRSQRELQNYTASLEEVITERTRLLEEQARHDGLTGLLNQRAFYKELTKELARGQRRNHTTVLVYFDLDGFKQVNDREGHTRGDEILVAVAEAMRATLRANETGVRYGGDEYCIIFPEGTIDEAEQACKRLCKSIKEAVGGGQNVVTCSMGISVADPGESCDAHILVQKADKAMYEAKLVEGFAIVVAEP